MILCCVLPQEATEYQHIRVRASIREGSKESQQRHAPRSAAFPKDLSQKTKLAAARTAENDRHAIARSLDGRPRSLSSYLIAPEQLVVVDIFDAEIGREELQYTVSSHILAVFTRPLPVMRLAHGQEAHLFHWLAPAWCARGLSKCREKERQEKCLLL